MHTDHLYIKWLIVCIKKTNLIMEKEKLLQLLIDGSSITTLIKLLLKYYESVDEE